MATAVRRSMQEYARGVAGGLLFSLPFLYTEEVWRAGTITSPSRLLAGVAGTLLVLFAYNRFAGLRRDASAAEVVIDSVEEFGIGLALSAVILALVGQLDADTPALEAVGKVVVEGLAVAIGVSVGTAQLSGGGQDSGLQGDEEDESSRSGGARRFAGQMALAMCGAVLIAANIAPTDEVVKIAAAADTWRLLGLTGLTLAVGALVLHASDFVGSERHVARGRPGDVVTGTVANYLAAMLAAAAMLWFFGRFSGVDASACGAQVVVLAMPAALGASAGRLLLQQ
jgi:putative integral membrane protein (TIGR02587 family)